MKRFAIRELAALALAALMGTTGMWAKGEDSSAVATSERNNVPEVRVLPFDGVGPVVMGSVGYLNLPNATRKFLDKHCDGAAIVRCDKVYTNGEYEISLADGIEMAFDSRGALVDIEAPMGYSLSSNLVKAILPKHTFKGLKKYGLDVHVGSIVHDEYGFHVNFNGSNVVNEVLFNHSGDFVASYQN